MAGEKPPTLFDEGRLADLIHNGDTLLAKETAAIEGERILSTSLHDLADYFCERFYLQVPSLKMDEAHTLPPEDIEMELHYGRDVYFRDKGPHYVKGSLFTLCVPFTGDPDLFKYLPSTHYLNHVFGEVDDHTLVLRQQKSDPDTDEIKKGFEGQLKPIQEYLERQRVDVSRWNEELPGKVASLLAVRKEKALKAVNVAESLGFPLKRRDKPTYTVPVTRKRLAVQMPQAKAGPYKPEPVLEERQYDDILQMISSLAITMERNPSTFSSMKEEQLRDQLLVILNANFEGQATGETFNKSGKTDILIRAKDRNIFIAECKFWGGSKVLTAAIDQLLGYACWRDTKLAIILFNRRKDFSAVLDAIPETVASHPQCKRQLDYKSESGFRFFFGQKDDANRELTLTLLAFDVPGVLSDTPEPTKSRTPVKAPAPKAAARAVKRSPRAPSPARRKTRR